MVSDSSSFAGENRRRMARAPVADTLFIQTIGADQVTAVDTSPKPGNAVDASLCGMQVELDFEVLEQSEIALWITPAEGKKKFMVNGVVRWTRPAATPNRFLIGIELDQQALPDMEQWLTDRRGNV